MNASQPTAYRIELLGSLRIHHSNQPIANPTSEKIQALLAWLAAEPDRAHSREFLAELIWHDQPEGMAKQNLRQALSRLQRAVALNGEEIPWLEITRQTVQVKCGQTLWVDLHRFGELLRKTAAHRHEQMAHCPTCCAQLTEAVDLYRDDFLLGLSPNSPAFDEWALLKREWLRREVLQALDTLVHFYEVQGDAATAYRFAWRRVEIDPLLEDAHQQVMRTLAQSGHRNEALAQYETLTRLLRDELGVAPASETTEFYEVILDGNDKVRGWQGNKVQMSSPPHLVTLSPCLNLPPQHTPFIGRQAELAQIAERLAHPNCHLLTLVGLGGIGKTRLAIEAARAQAASFVDGVHFVNLAPIHASDLLPITIAEAVGLSLGEEAETYAQQRATLLEQLQSRNLLLILDNLEQLLSAPNVDPLLDLVVELLQLAPNVTLLVTSRQPLGLRAEWVFDVAGLGMPNIPLPDPPQTREGTIAGQNNQTFSIPELLPPLSGEGWGGVLSSDAVQLFIQSTQRILPNFAADNEIQPILEICQSIGGIALGIELAAAWSRQFSPAEILQRIRASYDFLATTMRDVPERQRSLRVVFESAWGLLNETEQAIYRRLANFRGSFDLAAATVVASASADDVRRFCELSLLRVDSATADDERYSLHETLRQFAAEKLTVLTEEAMQSRILHAFHYLGLLHREEEHLNSAGLHEAMSRIRREIDNVRAAWASAVEFHHSAALSQGLSTLLRYFVMSSQVEEGVTALGTAADSLRQHLQNAASPDAGEIETLAEILAYRGRLFYKLARYPESIAHCEEALALAQQIEANRPAALANLYSGIALVNLGAFNDSREKFEAARMYAERAAWRKVEGDAIRGLGIVADSLDDLETATAYYEESAALCREIDDVRGLSASIGNLGSIYRRKGDFGRAQQLTEEALAISLRIGDRSSEGRSLSNLGELSVALEEYAKAESYFVEALTVQRAIKEPQYEADTLTCLGELCARTNRTEEAHRYWQQALSIYEAIGEVPHRDRVLAYLQAYGK